MILRSLKKESVNVISKNPKQNINSFAAELGTFVCDKTNTFINGFSDAVEKGITKPIGQAARSLKNFGQRRIEDYKKWTSDVQLTYLRLKFAKLEAKLSGNRARYETELSNLKCRVKNRLSKMSGAIWSYAVPMVALVMLFGIVGTMNASKYGISVELDGSQLGVVRDEKTFNIASVKATDHIGLTGNEIAEINPQYSIRLTNGNFTEADELADRLLLSADKSLVYAYGVFVDEEFIGAVDNTSEVRKKLVERQTSAEIPVGATNVRFGKDIEYTEGLYPLESLKSSEELLKIMLGEEETDVTYEAVANDTYALIASKYNVSEASLRAMNPSVAEVSEGSLIHITKMSSYLPLAYDRTLTTITFTDYTTKRVRSSEIYSGQTAVITKGEQGETENTLTATYIDGVETSRTLVSSKEIKKPVEEVIGVGTHKESVIPTRTSSSNNNVQTVQADRGTGTYCWPINGGILRDGIGAGRGHGGVDICAPQGTEIYAAADGVVICAEYQSNGYGNLVKVDHGDGHVTYYAHMSEIRATVGQTVKAGELLGLVGQTGRASGNHLHFEVQLNGSRQDPLDYI
jgi:murein DD-endopeptidase MepM/ murein hydrolase activator NlpD